jgi:hypothetical protein
MNNTIAFQLTFPVRGGLVAAAVFVSFGEPVSVKLIGTFLMV